jgi:uncharacterized protein (DUF2235 family)
MNPASAADPTTTRQLVVCCDGTNNTFTGDSQDTNVLKLCLTLSRAPSNQLVYYDPGVGSPDNLPPTSVLEPLKRKLQRAFALAVGRGIYQNVGEAYLFLCREYREGDQIWLFGFSRGAFTVRAVAGMVNLFGLIRPEHEPLLPTLLSIYFSANEDTQPWHLRQLRRARGWLRARAGLPAPASRDRIAAQILDAFSKPAGRAAPVHFTGVWDTVETVGIHGLRKSISSKASLGGKRFVHLRHALSLDEHRHAFLPRYFTGPIDAGQTLKQVWFRGVHGDVGGGTFAGQSGLSTLALEWMVDEARDCGLRCPDYASWPALSPVPRRMLNDELYATPWWAVAGMSLRDPRQAPGGNVGGASMSAPLEHPSVAGEPPQTLWAQWRSWGKFGFALVVAALLLVTIGAQLLAASQRPQLFDPASWGRALPALDAARAFAWTQTLALFDPQSFLAQGTGVGARKALLWDFGFIVAYAYLLARLSSRAFAWLAQWRRVGDPIPWWARWQLGRALPLLLVADVVENVIDGLAFSLQPEGWFVHLLLRLGGIATLAKWLGFAGVLLLALVGWRGRARAAAARPPALQRAA